MAPKRTRQCTKFLLYGCKPADVEWPTFLCLSESWSEVFLTIPISTLPANAELVLHCGRPDEARCQIWFIDANLCKVIGATGQSFADSALILYLSVQTFASSFDILVYFCSLCTSCLSQKPPSV